MMIAATLVTLLLLPGIPLGLTVMRSKSLTVFLPIACALGIAWSGITTFFLTILHVPITWETVLPLAAAPALLLIIPPVYVNFSFPTIQRMCIKKYTQLVHIVTHNCTVPSVVLVIGISGFLSIPFLTIHSQLPTGDIQKAIFWADRIIQHRTLPNYSESLLLNRDPTDFITPGLHTLTAAAGTLSGKPLAGPAWLAFTASIILAALAASIVTILGHPRASLLTFVFVAFSSQFLRYAFAPGYHFQNLIGELLLVAAFALFLLALRTHRSARLYIASVILLVLIPLIHQFTAFLALLLVPLLFLVAALLNRHHIIATWRTLQIRKKQMVSIAAILIFVMLFGIVLASPLPQKIPHLFTIRPHLINDVVLLTAYPHLIGSALLLFGIAGIILTIPRRQGNSKERPVVLFAVWTVALLILGQGPHIFIDIPSSRTLFYAVIPLAVFSGIFAIHATDAVRTSLSPKLRIVAVPLIATALIAPFAHSASQELSSLTHSTRVQTTITPDLLETVTLLETENMTKHNPRILVDNWNRRRLTWTILSPYSMVTRLGGDMDRVSGAARQSDMRTTLYRNSVDYEKIFMLGNSSLIAPLLMEHNIHFIGTSRRETASVFAENPLVSEYTSGNDYVIFQTNFDAVSEAMKKLDDEAGFLLNHATLVNNVGDNEDTASHTPLFLSGTRRTEAELLHDRPVRTITSPVTIHLNAETYVQPLWDPEERGIPRTPVRVLFRVFGNGASFSVAAGDTTNSFDLPNDEQFHYIATVFDPEDIPLGTPVISLIPESDSVILDIVGVGLAE